MEFSKPGNETMEFGFEVHPIGTYAFQILEGVKISTNDDDPDHHGMSLMIPLQSTDAKTKPKTGEPGDPDAVGGKLNHFIYILKKDTGEEVKKADGTIRSLIENTDLSIKFRKQFPKGAPPTDEKLLGQLVISLPGKFISAEIIHRKDDKGGVQSQIKSWGRYGKKKAAPAKAPDPDPDPQTTDGDTGEGEGGGGDNDGWD